MSSRGRQTRGSSGSSGFIVAHPAEDLVADLTSKGADRLGLRVALRPAVLDGRLAAGGAGRAGR